MLRSLALALLLAACSGDDESLPPDAGGRADAAAEADAAGAVCPSPPMYVEDVSGCAPLATDYQPRVNGSADDPWPACISDDNEYHRIMDTISTIARVEAFEQIAALLWSGDRRPSPAEFIDARVIYAQDQGLDSRLQRREDVHYPPPMPAGAKCADLGVPELYPDRCVGPAKLLPILNDAFQKGSAGESPRVQAARIEAALLWFLYVSPLSEVMSCTTTPKDCDSAWAYYTGGTPRDLPIGLARYVDGQGPETHDRGYDGTLAVRCWRNLDNEIGEAMDLALRDQAREQLDVAMLRGVALILRQRFAELDCTTGDVRDARFAFIQVIAPLLDRAARERDPALADALLAEATATGPDAVDVPAALAAIDAIFPCP